MEYLKPLWENYVFTLILWAKYWAFFLVLEMCLPAERGQSWRARFFNLRYTMVYAFLFLLITPSVSSWVVSAPTQKWPQFFGWFDRYATPLGMPIWLQVLIYLMVYDFFYYWFHRAQHQFSWLWRQHRLHHSDQVLNVTSSMRHHWLEEPLKVFVVALPISIIFGAPPQMGAWLGITIGAWGFYIHSNIYLGKSSVIHGLNRWLVSPQVHRVHHSRLPEHHDKNFAAIFSFWDRLFGTYHAAHGAECPPTGLDTREDYDSVWRASLAPILDPRPMPNDNAGEAQAR
jgi:sterol desaturase/sphingolipid hydroxylase (fatty acid hydroxylase superfamily)